LKRSRTVLIGYRKLGCRDAPTERKYMRVLPTEQSESKWLFRMKCRKRKRERLESCFCGEDTPTIRMGDERSKGFKRTFLLGCHGLGATSHLAVLTTLLNARLVNLQPEGRRNPSATQVLRDLCWYAKEGPRDQPRDHSQGQLL